MTKESLTIVVGSAGRRLYLIDWFRDAFDALGIEGRIVVTEHDPTSAAASYGDVSRLLPSYRDPSFDDELIGVIDEFEPKLFVSLNDYELMHVHVDSTVADVLRARGVLVPGVSAAWQRGCADKLRMSQLLEGAGIPTPTTVTGGDVAGLADLRSRADELVVKHRFGSGSSGLAVVRAEHVDEAVAAAAANAPARGGQGSALDEVIVQPRLGGAEHGVDIIAGLREEGVLTGVLARRKLRMRAGETDKAVTVAPDPFVGPAEQIARAAGLSGLIDVDMFLDESGSASVIDINPRFGGGYPFMHLAGADVPRYYLAQALGIPLGDGWKQYTAGVVSAKYERIRVTSHEGG